MRSKQYDYGSNYILIPHDKYIATSASESLFGQTAETQDVLKTQVALY